MQLRDALAQPDRPVPQQAQRVHHDQERGADVRGDRAPKRGKGQGHEQRLDGERERDVLADDGERATRVLDQPGQLREVIGHERDVGGLDRGIAAAAPMAIPKLARAMAGASLTPSPTIATVPYFETSSSTALTLSSGRSSA